MGKEAAKELYRKFETGATRDTADNKLQYEAYLSPTVLKAFAEYMRAKQLMPDGTRRNGDNWQKGIPKDAYVDSMFRHFHSVWSLHRGYEAFDEKDNPVDMKTELCALMFNVMGYMFEEIDPKSASNTKKP